MTLDLERLRAETPGVANRIHLNNADAGLMPAPLIAAIKDHLTQTETAARAVLQARPDMTASDVLTTVNLVRRS